MSVRVAGTGFGLAGRNFLRAACAEADPEVLAVNDAADASTLARRLGYDSFQAQSPDIIGSPCSSIVDSLTTIVHGTHVKVVAGSDNEGGHSILVDLAQLVFAPVAAVAAADGGLSS